MDGASRAGSVLVIDHDRFFKELLKTFFVEFLELFFPKLAEPLDRDSLEFLSQELFSNLFEGRKYYADLIVKAKFKGSTAFFLIHVEHQSTVPADFPRRFFGYYSLIFEKHGVPVYPIVVYSHEAPTKAQPSVYRMDFPDGEVLRFHYRVVQLNRLSWRKFVNTPNPVASALMAKMKIAAKDRPRVKLECLRLMLTLKLDPGRMRLIASFVDAYLNLSESENLVFRRTVENAELPTGQREEVVEYLTSWERKGIEIGREEGRQEGRQEGRVVGRVEGRVEALREVLLDGLLSRFGPLDEKVVAHVHRIESVDELRTLTHRVFTASSLGELGF